VTVGNNTFFNQTNWIGFTGSSLEQGTIAIRNNLILQVKSVQLRGDHDLAWIAAHWMSNNWWESTPATDATQARLVSQPREPPPALDVLSRDRENPAFLRPAHDSPLAQAAEGPGPGFVGAIAPAPPPVSSEENP
jgi:hypothetical protein